MFVITTNGPQIYQDIKSLLFEFPRILDRDQDQIEAIIRVGMQEQFEILSREEGVQEADGNMVFWPAISGWTADIREDMGFEPYDAVLVMTGSLRHAVENGTTIAIKDGADSYRLFYMPGDDQAERIEKHEEGFIVTDPISKGKTSKPRPALFWGEAVTERVIFGIERGLESLIKSRGF